MMRVGGSVQAFKETIGIDGIDPIARALGNEAVPAENLEEREEEAAPESEPAGRESEASRRYRELTAGHAETSAAVRERIASHLSSDEPWVVYLGFRAAHATLSESEFEVLLLEQNTVNDWWVMVRPGKRARLNTRILFKNRSGQMTSIEATVTETNCEGHRRLQFAGTPNLLETLDALGEVPLPPYIKRDHVSDLAKDAERYQTVYAREQGSVAAPTAGLHFTEKLLEQITGMGVKLCRVTLHVGLGTFTPVKAAALSDHVMHHERYRVDEEAARCVNECKQAGRRIIAVGTTSIRVLESVAAVRPGPLVAGEGRTNLFIHPPRKFRVVDALLTNFHLPCSTLLMLVSAFASPGFTHGREIILAAYAEAVRERYRFFSYGDAMLIL